MKRIRAPRLWIAGGAAAVMLAAGIGVAAASDGSGGSNTTAGESISCPTVADKLPAIPAAAKDEVDRNLALLDKQIAEANNRLATTKGQGGPNFVQNAILGPLADKRRSTIDRIAIAIGRHADRPTGLDGLATCSVAGAGVEQPPAEQPGEDPAAEEPPAEEPPATEPPPAAAGTISCPTVADKLPAIPAAAKDEVDRNLALLDKQIAEANNRLATTKGQGGPNFVQNAILGPLADKRRSTIDRIAIAIGRHADRPTGLDTLATCTVA